jgi:hypothetical protein
MTWLVQSSVVEEGTNRGQPAIAAAGDIASTLLDVVKEGAHEGGVDICQC